MIRLLFVTFAVLSLFACPRINPLEVDFDQDGFPLADDCDDNNAEINPEATEFCDFVDNNCNGEVDEGAIGVFYLDQDGDGFGQDGESINACPPPPGYAAQAGDCNDNNAQINPDAPEISCNGVNEDCDNDTADLVDADGDQWHCIADCNDANPSIYPQANDPCGDGIDSNCDGSDGTDGDGDGYAVCEGDCDDNNGALHPFATDVIGDGVDSDCDGIIDNGNACPCGAVSIAEALDLCNSPTLLSHQFITTETAPAPATGILQGSSAGWGNPSLDPQMGCEMGAISSGLVLDTCDWIETNPNFEISGDCGNHTDPNPAGPGPSMICDLIKYKLTLQAPSNAQGFSFDFLFMSSEYPEWINQGFNDTFYAILEAPSVNAGAPINISFDPSMNAIEVDNSFFEAPGYAVPLTGTAYSCDAGSTGWLRTTWSITPNETFTLTFTIHDEGDAIFDSLVLLDNFQWYGVPVDDGTTQQ